MTRIQPDLGAELRDLESETFEVLDLADVSMEVASTTACSSSCTSSSCTSTSCLYGWTSTSG